MDTPVLTPSIEDIVREVLRKIGNSAPAIVPSDPVTDTNVTAGPSGLMEVIPEFGGDELGDDSSVWCDLVEEITKAVTGQQRLSLATHALTGPAKKWYRDWKGRPRTWEKFREDLCSVFVSEKRLHQRMHRAISYNSDAAASYAQYARTKLMYLEQSRVNFKPTELVELIIGAIVDENVRQAMMNGNHQTTASAIVAIAQFGKSVPEKKILRERENPSRKRCFVCQEEGHLKHQCTKKRKLDNERKPTTRVVSCNFCAKRGHEEAQCFLKQRQSKEAQGRQKAGGTRGAPEVNACYSVDHELTPVLLKDELIQDCLIDNGATCSLIRERIAKRLLKIDPFQTGVDGFGNGKATTLGCATAIVQTEDVAFEVDMFVVPDTETTHDLIIGKNVLPRGGLRMVTESDGRTKLEHSPTKVPRNSEAIQQGLVCNIADALNADASSALRTLLDRFGHMITTGSNVRSVSTGELKITLTSDKIINYHPYRLSVMEREKVRDIVNDLLEHGIIRESVSPYASPVILVKKKNGKDRLCIDFRALNQITRKDRYPLPLIDDQLDRLGKGKFFTTLDMASGFYQIPIEANSIEKTAFVTPDGHYEFMRMPFGLANAPAVFQRAINAALGNLRNNVALAYMDDILIPSETTSQGLEYLERVLEALDKAGFTLNMEKCSFFKTSIQYLGREISSEGIRPGKEKVKALLESPVPTSVTQVRQFLGLASYFRKFIPELAAHIACVTKLTKKNEPWQWGKEQDRAREYVLEKLSSKPLLIVFDPERETELHTDASSIGYGAILFQKVAGEMRVVAYYSRRTTPEESRYHSYELETLAIVNALRYFRVYLLGIKFKIVTDCNAIKATQTKKDLLPRIARWWVYLQDYTFELEYRKGKCIAHADYLSRNPRKDYRVNVVCVGSWLEVAQKQDDETKDIIKRLERNDTVCSDFEVRQGILCRKILRDTGRIVYRSYVPKGSRLGLLRIYHDENCHVGFDKTYDRVSQKFWFPRMRSFVKKYLDHCITCVVSKRGSGAKQGFLHSIPKIPVPFDTIHCDCVGPFTESKEGYQHILIIVDAFTKYLQLVPLKSLSGPETLQVFKERLTLFGTPRVVVLDRATNFTYKPLEQFIRKLDIELHLIATGAPRANGQAERYVSTVTNLLTVEAGKSKEWPNKLPRLMCTLNTTIQKSTGFSPSRLLFGIERSAGKAIGAEAELPDTNDIIDVNQDREIAADRLKANAEKQDERFNRKRRNNIVYSPGDSVFVKPADTRRAKLDDKYVGPFTISEVLANDRFQIVGKTGRPQIVPKDRLRPWKGEWAGDSDIIEEENVSADEPC